MELNFREILIIISVVAILGIYINGRYKIRKGKNPYKLKAKKVSEVIDEPDDLEPRAYDSLGFDQDGVGRPKQVNSDHNLVEITPVDLISAPHVSEESLDQTMTEANFAQFEQPFEYTTDEYEQSLADKHSAEQSKVDPAMIEQAKTQHVAESRADNLSTVNALDEGEAVKPAKETNLNPKSSEEQKKIKIEQEVLALSVVMHDNQVISGAALLPSLLTLGMKFGEMNIFHRHQDNAGNGEITFSLANMVNPGTFDVDNMETFTTKGLTLFMTLPNADEPVQVFKYMLSAAKQIAKEFGGQVLDSKRSVMTKQTEQHYLSQIREFDRKSRLAGHE